MIEIRRRLYTVRDPPVFQDLLFGERISFHKFEATLYSHISQYPYHCILLTKMFLASISRIVINGVKAVFTQELI